MDGIAATSGLSQTIDYYLSFDGTEIPTATTHYCEQLVRLDGIHSLFS